MSEYGNIALVEEREEREGGKVTLRLPGVRKGDMASRAFKPEVSYLYNQENNTETNTQNFSWK